MASRKGGEGRKGKFFRRLCALCVRHCSERGPLFYKAHFPLSDCLRGRPPQPEARGFFSLRKKKEETPSILCVGCEERVPLWDEMEQCFASAEIAASVMERSGRLTSFAASVMERSGRLIPSRRSSTLELSSRSCQRMSKNCPTNPSGASQTLEPGSKIARSECGDDTASFFRPTARLPARGAG